MIILEKRRKDSADKLRKKKKLDRWNRIKLKRKKS